MNRVVRSTPVPIAVGKFGASIMSHGSAGLDQRGRELLVERVCDQGWAVAHAARARDIPDPRGPRPLRRASADLRR